MKYPLFYDKKLEAKRLKKQEIEKIKQELKELKKQKDYMSKIEYKNKKRGLKREKRQNQKKRLKNISTNSNLIPNLPPFFILLF